MLLRSKQDFGYGGGYGISKGVLYVAYAIDDSPTKTEVAVYPFSPKRDIAEVDPLFFPLGKFEVISDDVSAYWQEGVFPDYPDHTYRSFPEFFEDEGMKNRMHDWSLEGPDYRIINKYKAKYEALYKPELLT